MPELGRAHDPKNPEALPHVMVAIYKMGSEPLPLPGPNQYSTTRICDGCKAPHMLLFELKDDAPEDTAGPPWRFAFRCKACSKTPALEA